MGGAKEYSQDVRALWRYSSGTAAGTPTIGSFDFFSDLPFHPNSLRDSIPYLNHAEKTQFRDNTHTAVVDRNGPVKLSFFLDLWVSKRVHDPDVVQRRMGFRLLRCWILLRRAEDRSVKGSGERLSRVVSTLEAGLRLAEGLAAAHRRSMARDFNGATKPQRR